MSEQVHQADLTVESASYPGIIDSTVIVTGASNGVGRATAAVLASNGATVYGLDLDADSSDGGPKFEDVVDDGRLVVGDVTDRAVVEALVEEANADGGLDAVVNNAGIAGNGILEDVEPEAWQRTFDVHVNGTRNVCQAALPALQNSGQGSIVNISSIAALGAYAGAADYAAAKAAIIGMTQQLSADYSPQGVRANAVAPGFVRTQMNAAVWQAAEGGIKEGFKEHPVVERTLLPYTAEPVDIAHTIVFLCSDAARFITGQTVPVDGGWSV